MVVTFTDSGTGMGSRELERIFDPLYTTKIQGTGLGRAICYQIMRKHNGRLDVSSEKGAGATFTVRIPLKVGGTLPLDDGP